MIYACTPTLYAGLIVHSTFTRIVPMIQDSTHHTSTQQQFNHQACEHGPDHKRVDATVLRHIAFRIVVGVMRAVQTCGSYHPRIIIVSLYLTSPM